jgi:AhpD family alkylhydroperoxidase
VQRFPDFELFRSLLEEITISMEVVPVSNDFPAHNQKLRELMGALGKEIPDTMGAFVQLHKAAAASGALDAKTKELISLAIAITVRCNGCIAFHVHDALKAGAVREEIVETIAVAILMGGGPSVVYGTEALEALNQFEKAGLN